MVARVFSVLSALMVSLLVWTLLFGYTGRQIMWNGLRPAFEREWDLHTMNSGELANQEFQELFNKGVDLTTGFSNPDEHWREGTQGR